jgi:hypothetical protein
MKSRQKVLLFVQAVLIALLALLLVWTFWPRQAAKTVASMPKATSLPTAATPESAFKPAQVEAPKLAPAVPSPSSLGSSTAQPGAVDAALPQGFRTSPSQEMALKIELDDLIRTAPKPLVIGDPRLWMPDPTPADPDALSVRRDALHYFLSDGTESDARDTYSVDVYYVPSENRFYFRRMSAHGPSSTYGPFDGDPVTMLGLTRQP